MSNLGYVKKTGENTYQGSINLLRHKGPILIRPFRGEPGRDNPDMEVVTPEGDQLGTARNLIGKTTGKPYVNVAIKHVEVVGKGNVLFLTLGRANDVDEDDVFALIA